MLEVRENDPIARGMVNCLAALRASRTLTLSVAQSAAHSIAAWSSQSVSKADNSADFRTLMRDARRGTLRMLFDREILVRRLGAAAFLSLRNAASAEDIFDDGGDVRQAVLSAGLPQVARFVSRMPYVATMTFDDCQVSDDRLILRYDVHGSLRFDDDGKPVRLSQFAFFRRGPRPARFLIETSRADGTALLTHQARMMKRLPSSDASWTAGLEIDHSSEWTKLTLEPVLEPSRPLQVLCIQRSDAVCPVSETSLH